MSIKEAPILIFLTIVLFLKNHVKLIKLCNKQQMYNQNYNQFFENDNNIKTLCFLL